MQFIQPDLPIINPGFYQLAYCSILKDAMGQPEIDALVAHAQANNAKHEITGLMMIDQGLIVQWIEGRRSVVRNLWDNLLADPRHYCVVELLHRDFQDHRMYPDWSMRLASRIEMIATVRQAHDLAQAPLGLPNPWAPAITKLCELIDPAFAETT